MFDFCYRVHNRYLIWIKGNDLTISFTHRGHCFKDPHKISISTSRIMEAQRQSAAN
jgi:hypothetical protein